MRRTAIVLTVLGLSAALAPPGPAAPLSVRDSFRIGTSGSSFCSAQPAATDPVLTGMFDVGYSVTCKDATLPVGKLYVLRSDESAAKLAAARTRDASCQSPMAGSVEGLGPVEIAECKLNGADVGYRVYHYRQGKQLYVAEGLSGYDSAIQLGLRSIVADSPVAGEVSIATTGAGDPAAFARVQAGTLDPTRALAEAYRRNNVGNYADAAEFFASVRSVEDAPISRSEAFANEALQKSNLGRFAEADSLFDRAAEAVGGDAIDARRLRNYRAMHLLNQGRHEDALSELDKPMPKSAASSLGSAGSAGLEIDSALAKRLNAESRMSSQLGQPSDELLPEEKAEILDGQALQLRGTSLRLAGDHSAASSALQLADSKLESVRGGKVASIAWMRAQIVGDLAAIAEQTGDMAQADRLYRQGLSILEINYPGSAALLNARARLAGYLARTGQTAAAEAMFRDIVRSRADSSDLPPSFARVLRPYIDLLLQKEGDSSPASEIFLATQLMMRPGLAQTQAVLARELSGGTGEASRLFRQAVTLTRQVERARIALARIESISNPAPQDLARASALRTELDATQKDALTTQASLAGFPRYRAVSSEVIPLSELQASLRPGEGYYRMTIVDDGIYAFFTTSAASRVVKLPLTAEALDGQVTALRESIVTVERGQQITYAYDVPLAHKLYKDLFAPFDSEIARTRHLIFEPDGAMLRMPPNALIVDQKSVDQYRAKVAANPDADFDFTGINWLGRERDISTAVSPRSFANLRAAPPAAGRKQYLGLGSNIIPAAETDVAGTAANRECILPLANWKRPISPRELKVAADILGKAAGGGTDIVTGEAFTDTAIKEQANLDDYRIIHFATHGVVTAPRPECPTQPALLTSFGGGESDGLLTFREIFDLDLDADIVILSACDTAGTASAVATQSAGLGTGGDVALDGLVRAFVGAGGRLVVASHWPVPDDFNATQRLVTGLFTASPGTPAVSALRLSQRSLMDDVDTSHPFYWSAFAVVGDGQMPVIRAPAQIAQN